MSIQTGSTLRLFTYLSLLSIMLGAGYFAVAEIAPPQGKQTAKTAVKTTDPFDDAQETLKAAEDFHKRQAVIEEEELKRSGYKVKVKPASSDGAATQTKPQKTAPAKEAAILKP